MLFTVILDTDCAHKNDLEHFAAIDRMKTKITKYLYRQFFYEGWTDYEDTYAGIFTAKIGINEVKFSCFFI